jgi:Cof subfamily protein (haloacid dehalogenase superfamily)
MDPTKIKALAIDLDGTTLLPDAVLGDRTRDCLQKLLSNGMQIIIATGRAIEASEKYFTAIGSQGPMVFFNGAEVVDIPSGKVISSNLISLDVADFCVDVARDLDVFFQVYLPAGVSPDTGEYDPKQKWGALLIEKRCTAADMYIKHTDVAPVIKDLKTIASMPGVKGCVKGMFIADPSLHKEIRKRMFERFGDSVNVIRSFPTFLEVLNTGVSKGDALKIAMQHRGLKPEDVISFGDEENDLSMFTVTAFSGAPESARDKIKEKAGFIFGSNAEEGLAVWLEKTFL